MKKILILLATAAAAVCLAASCDRNEPVAPETPAGDLIKTGISLKAKTADAPESKTHIVATDDPDTGTATYTSHWDATGESLGLLLFKGSLTSANVPVELPGEDSEGSILFHKSNVDVEAGTNNMFLFYPYSAYDSTGDGYLVANLKSSQSPVLGSFDPSCDVMGYSTNNVNVVEGQDVVIENITLQRPMAIVRVRLNCGVDDKAYGEKVSSFKMALSIPMPLTGKFKVTTTGDVDIVTPATYVEATYDLAKTLIAIGDATCNSVYLVTLPVTIPSGTDITFTIETQNYHGENAIVRTKTVESNMTLQSGKVNVIDLKVRDKDFPEEQRYAGGTGVDGDPWLVATPAHMLHMAEDLTSGETKYFKLIEDIDMDGIEWTLMNDSGSYDKFIDLDGNNKTISHLGGTLFYVFKGSVKDLVLDSPSVTAGNQKGTFAQYIQGTDNHITNVDVRNVSEFAASTGNCGGLVGRINGGSEGAVTATFKDCDLTDITVNSSGKAGGFIGSVEAKVVIENCTCTGGKVSNTSNYAGGLIGYATAEVSIKDCAVSGTVSGVQYAAGLVGYLTSGSITNTHSSVNVSSTGHYAGGLIAYMVNGTIGQSYSTGNITATAKCYRIGGIVGFAENGSLNQCYATGSYSGTQSQYMGGMIGTVSTGSSQAVTISECAYTTGTIAPSGNYAGGLVGTKEGDGSLTISNCYASGNPKKSGPQRFGGILAGHLKGSSTLENCYFSGELAANACIGGIVGWVETDGLSVVRCMPFPAELHATQNVSTADRYCSGLVIGYARKDQSAKVVVNHCYRTADIASHFQDYVGVAATNVVEDHDFITVAAQIPQRHGLQYGYYHHGKETDSATLSALVQRNDIGGAWSSSIWDFSQDYPRLKWMLE